MDPARIILTREKTKNDWTEGRMKFGTTSVVTLEKESSKIPPGSYTAEIHESSNKYPGIRIAFKQKDANPAGIFILTMQDVPHGSILVGKEYRNGVLEHSNDALAELLSSLVSCGMTGHFVLEVKEESAEGKSTTELRDSSPTAANDEEARCMDVNAK